MNAPLSALLKNSREGTMRDDPIVEEVRKARQKHANCYGNDLDRITAALIEAQTKSGRLLVRRSPRLRTKRA